LCEFFEEKDEGRKIVIKKKIDVIWKFSDKARKALATEEDEKKIISFLRKIRKRT